MNTSNTAEVLVSPDDRQRFLDGCRHYGMEAKRKGRSDYYIVKYKKAEDLYWFGANMFGNPAAAMTNSSMYKRPF